MPKRNKLPPMPDYVGNGKNPEKLLVQKSNPLLCLSETGMTLPELKILDVYLSRINSHEPDKRSVRFEKGEFEKLLGNTWMHKDDLVKRLKNLFQVVEIADERYPKNINLVSLFEKASCEQDENGLWQVDLMCTPSAMEYIFNVEKLGYLKYRLKSVVNLTSRYSYVLYLFLESNCYRRNIEVPLDDLKKMLNCTAETYDEFRRFNDLVLKKCQKEINEKTDISFTYSTVKKGRRVVAVSFEVERKPRMEITAEPTANAIKPPKREAKAIAFAPQSEELPIKELQPEPSGFHSFETDFTQEELQVLTIMLNAKLSVPDNKLADRILRAKYAECKLTCPNAKKPFAYLITAITKMSVEEFERKQADNSDGFVAEDYEMFLNNF